SPPSLFVDDGRWTMDDGPTTIVNRAEIAAHWARLRKLSEPGPSLSGTLAWCTACIPEIRRLRARVRDAELGEEGASERSDALRWLEGLSRRISASWAASEAL